jgi:histone deacetylase 1/2
VASIGFEPCPYDPCLLKRGVGQEMIKIAVYVDDLKLAGHSIIEIRKIIAGLDNEYGKLKVTEGLKHNYLGMHFDYSVKGKVNITMPKIVEGILTEYGVTGTAETPAGNDLFKVGDSAPASEAEKTTMYSITYKLLHLAKRVRPDILTATSYLTTRVSKPNVDDIKKMTRVLKYLNGTRELGICIETDPGPISVKAYIDASYAVHDDCRSQTGCIISLGKGPIYTSSSKQKINTKSSTESEVVAIADKSSQVIWSREILGWLSNQTEEEMLPATIFEDNTAAIQMMKRGRGCSEKTRHIKIQTFFIGDRMENGDILLHHLNTEEMVADFLTKPLQGKQFIKLRNMLLNWKAV